MVLVPFFQMLLDFLKAILQLVLLGFLFDHILQYPSKIVLEFQELNLLDPKAGSLKDKILYPFLKELAFLHFHFLILNILIMILFF